MKNLFFGDSLTSGENNNNKSFVDYIPYSEKVGVSGTTIGEYSIYPVDGHSLLSLIPQNIEKIKSADNIFLEYGINDITAAITANTEASKITIAFVKALDYIKQINPKAKIYFLIATNAIETIAKNQCSYLVNDYLRYCYGTEYDYRRYAGTYEGFIEEVVKHAPVEVLDMFSCEEDLSEHLDKDNLHPTDEGYQIIANNLKKELYKEWKIA